MALSRADTCPKAAGQAKFLLSNKRRISHTQCDRVSLAQQHTQGSVSNSIVTVG